MMEELRVLEPFGHLNIPLLSDQEPTASYEAADWTCVSRAWKILMYRTVPGSNQPVEVPGGTLTISSMPQFRMLHERGWDDVAEEVLRNRAQLWNRLADF
jgi:hypothetical protein